MTSSGNGHEPHLMFSGPPKRVVSLVPSMTESLFDLGLGDSLVGITDYCTHPPTQVAALPRVGGTKNPRIEAIFSLKPDLILANQEENTPETVSELEARGLQVWVTFPKTLRQSLDVLWLLVGIFQSKPAALRLDTLDRALDWLEAESNTRATWRYFCPIWQSEAKYQPPADRWWMTFNSDTYMHDLLRLFGGVNIFADRKRRYPLEADLGLCAPEDHAGKDLRYPRVTYAEIIAGEPQIILLPNEPYPFEESHKPEFIQWFGEGKTNSKLRVIVFDGSLLTWHGTRLGKALSQLSNILELE